MQNRIQRNLLDRHSLLDQFAEQLPLFIDLRRLNLNANPSKK
jgi:hypothetical protein